MTPGRSGAEGRPSRRRRSDAKAITTQHSGVSYRYLRAACDWRNIAYDAVPSPGVLNQLARTLSLDLVCGDTGEVFVMEVERRDCAYLLRLPGFWGRIEDPRLVAQAEEEGRRKPGVGGGQRPVHLSVQGSALTLYGTGQVECIIEAIERGLYGDEVPPRLPGMVHLALDLELRGRRRDIDRLKAALFASPSTVQDSWVRWTRKDAVGEYTLRKGSSRHGVARQLDLGSRSGLALAIYEKTEEVARKGLDYREALYSEWREQGWDGERDVLRVEVRAAQDWLRKQRLDGGAHLDQLLGDELDREFETIFRTAVDRNRFCPGHGDRRRRPDHPFWAYVRQCAERFQYEEPEREVRNIVRADRERRIESLLDDAGRKIAAVATVVDRRRYEVWQLIAARLALDPDELETYLDTNGYYRLADERFMRDQEGVPSATTQYQMLQAEVGG